MKDGGIIIITARGNPVGQIVPVQPDLATRLWKWSKQEWSVGWAKCAQIYACGGGPQRRVVVRFR